MIRTRKLLAVVASVALAASVAAPADAASDTFKDKVGDIKGGFDIHSVHVKNDGAWVKVRTKHRNLKYGMDAPGGGVSVYIDTAKSRKGPEFRFGGPVGFDGDYSIVKVRRWKAVGGPLRCGLRFGVNYKAEVVRFAVKRRCMDRVYDHRVGKVRVAVHAAQSRAHGQPKVDWAPKRHRLYRAVARG
ncbi:MAG: hypothetical protein ACRDO7_14115 [Nocardioidaceae bacterium]